MFAPADERSETDKSIWTDVHRGGNSHTLTPLDHFRLHRIEGQFDRAIDGFFHPGCRCIEGQFAMRSRPSGEVDRYGADMFDTDFNANEEGRFRDKLQQDSGPAGRAQCGLALHIAVADFTHKPALRQLGNDLAR